MRKFRDTESGDIVTIDELRAEFESLKASDPETFDYDFSGYIRNCTDKNGFLEEIK